MAVKTKAQSALTIRQILTWADAHHAKTGAWPSKATGPVDGAPGEVWKAINSDLRHGRRGLPGGLTISQLLSRDRNFNPKVRRTQLFDITEILASADAYFNQNGEWPKADSGPVDGIPGQTWRSLDDALLKSYLGLSLDEVLKALRSQGPTISRTSFHKIEGKKSGKPAR